MLLRGTTSVATLTEFASRTSTRSVFCRDCAAAKLGTSRLTRIRLAAVDEDRPITDLRFVFVSNLRYVSGISTWKAGATMYEFKWFCQLKRTQRAHLRRPEQL